MKQIIIVALDMKGGFSKNKEIPWYYPDDFKWFKKQTEGRICVMGRHTYEEINQKLGDKAKESVLPNRKCFVVSSTLESLPNATVIKKYDDIFLNLTDSDHDDPNQAIFIIGGQQLYEETISGADIVMTTLINKDYECDQFFDTASLQKLFTVSQVLASKTSEDDLRFVIWTRKNHVVTSGTVQ